MRTNGREFDVASIYLADRWRMDKFSDLRDGVKFYYGRGQSGRAFYDNPLYTNQGSKLRDAIGVRKIGANAITEVTRVDQVAVNQLRASIKVMSDDLFSRYIDRSKP